jgi:hypothetical protein
LGLSVVLFRADPEVAGNCKVGQNGNCIELHYQTSVNIFSNILMGSEKLRLSMTTNSGGERLLFLAESRIRAFDEARIRAVIALLLREIRA